MLFDEWIMWALNLAENPIRWNNLNPASNWWYFQVIWWSSDFNQNTLFNKYFLYDNNFKLNYSFIYKTFYKTQWNNRDKTNFKNIWFPLWNNWMQIQKDEIIKIWKILKKLNQNDYIIYKNVYQDEYKTYEQLFKEFQLNIQLRNSIVFNLINKKNWILTNWQLWLKRTINWHSFHNNLWIKYRFDNLWIETNYKEIKNDFLTKQWKIFDENKNKFIQIWITNKQAYNNLLYSF